MSKTLAVILNHNLPDETNSLFESLEPYQNDDYDLVVVENGCSEDGKSDYSTIGIVKLHDKLSG
jgi:hypothetical protein